MTNPLTSLLPGTTRVFSQLYADLSSFSRDDVVRGVLGTVYGGLPPVPTPARLGEPNQYEKLEHVWTPSGKLDPSPGWFDVYGYMRVHYEIPYLAIAGYLVVITVVPLLMRGRQPFGLERLLFVWNALLAGLSMAGTVLVLQDAYAFREQGHSLLANLCSSNEWFSSPWVMLFCASKFAELLDTVFLVLRKRPVIFLHWYHHIATLLYCWDALSHFANVSAIFCIMNLAIHSIMYLYYCLMTVPALKIRIPAAVSKLITLLQITQMVGGLAFLLLAAEHCPLSYLGDPFRQRLNLAAGLIMYISYFVLFVHLFLNRSSRSPRLASQSSPSTPKI